MSCPQLAAWLGAGSLKQGERQSSDHHESCHEAGRSRYHGLHGERSGGLEATSELAPESGRGLQFPRRSQEQCSQRNPRVVARAAGASSQMIDHRAAKGRLADQVVAEVRISFEKEGTIHLARPISSHALVPGEGAGSSPPAPPPAAKRERERGSPSSSCGGRAAGGRGGGGPAQPSIGAMI